MSSEFNLDKLSELFQKNGVDNLKKLQSDDIKNMDDISLFTGDGEIDKKLLTKEGFINSLYDGPAAGEPPSLSNLHKIEESLSK